MTLLKLETAPVEVLLSQEHQLTKFLIHPMRLQTCNHLTLLDAMFEVAGRLYLVRLELLKREQKEAA